MPALGPLGSASGQANRSVAPSWIVVFPVKVAPALTIKTPLPFSVRLPLPETTPESDSGPPTIVASTAPRSARSAAIVAPAVHGPTRMRLVTPRLFPAIE